MRLALLAVAVALLPTAAHARHRQAAPPAPTISERLDAIAPGEVVDVPEGDPASTMVRLQIDVRFGPADVSTPDRSVWLSNGLGRDDTMRRAGIDRLVLVRSATGIRISADAGERLASK